MENKKKKILLRKKVLIIDKIWKVGRNVVVVDIFVNLRDDDGIGKLWWG